MGATYTKAQAAASKKHMGKLEEIKLRVPKGDKEKIANMALREGKSMNQFILDKIMGVPYGYTYNEGNIVIHEPSAKNVEKIFKKYVFGENIAPEDLFVKAQEAVAEKTNFQRMIENAGEGSVVCIKSEERLTEEEFALAESKGIKIRILEE